MISPFIVMFINSITYKNITEMLFVAMFSKNGSHMTETVYQEIFDGVWKVQFMQNLQQCVMYSVIQDAERMGYVFDKEMFSMLEFRIATDSFKASMKMAKKGQN